MEDFLGYMSFSLIESFAVFSILFLFRINLFKIMGVVVLVSTLINIQNFFIREELSLSGLSTIINVVLTTIFFIAYLRIPLIWSILITLSGALYVGAIQTVIIYSSLGYFSLHEVQDIAWKGYTVQALSGLIGMSIGWGFYKLGKGFTFELEKLRFKGERIFVVSLISAIIVVLGLMISFESIFTNLIIFVVSSALLVAYYLRKDLEAHDPSLGEQARDSY
ncbi:hypothetical protein [Cohnella fermenti]|uniref:Uncharacterized protein n=1 Tax=Cohnella fermenti TaxID=2565925 RepID=A0A4S4BNG6_9BACL|nr:hypothetical protein [Cohnella fermenti]THF76226.1 hypothetical protein E6C55_19560 [Cohnella fermenti]